GKMLPGEDIRIGEVIVQSVERESSWADIVLEESGARIGAGSVVRETVAGVLPAASSAPASTAGSKTAAAAQPTFGSGSDGKIMVEWVGKDDLLLGDRDGYVTLYMNGGNLENPRYDNGTRVRAGGKEIRVKGPSVPFLVDWNGDGRPDLLVGDGGGYLHIYMNEGMGAFSTGVMVKAGGSDVDVGGRGAPCVADWNGDGKKDLVMGNRSGEIFLYINEGSNDQPVFGKRIKLNGGSLDVGSNSSPEYVDWDADGKKDLVIGNSDGEIFVFINQGTKQEPRFDNKGEKLPLKLGSDISPQVLKTGPAVQMVTADRNGEVHYLVSGGSQGARTFPEKKLLKAGKN
ncbi:MAG TPA: VCBS repeat-containing protein, partial [Thermodesulfobacteriota bacterium]|nr:VCBS repeat-containing protein [Thermodesulfobacteriota bacterium]